MSTWFDEQIACPTCDLEQTAKLARGIHISRAPEARDQVFDRTFHRVTCRGCATRFVAARPLVYTDMDRKHWVHVALAGEVPRWPEMEKLASDVFERAFIGSPLAAGLRDGFRLRLVFGIEELREKLVIWRAGYNDAIVECAKLQLIAKDTSLALADRLLVDAIDEQGAALLVIDAEDTIARRTLIPRSLLEQQSDDDDRLRRYLPELFAGGFVSWRRMMSPRYRAPR
jgi:hypothetical protein